MLGITFEQIRTFGDIGRFSSSAFSLTGPLDRHPRNIISN
jgi:hypothetical protein